MKTVTLRNAQDAYVDQAKPSKNYRNSAQMYLQDGAFGYLFFANPVPARAKIVTAKLRVWNGNDWVSTTMNVQRVASAWSVNRINWNNRPGVTGAIKTLTKNPAANEMWEFDVAPLLQLVSDGAKWYGFRIEVTGAARKWIHSTQSSNVNKRPMLEITWSEAPFAPSDLAPDDGAATAIGNPVLRFDFFDVGGDKTMDAYHLQVSATSDFTGALLYDSQWTLSESPSVDLAAAGMAQIAEGATAYWRVRVRDGAGEESSWSHTASFRRLARPTAALTSPGANGLFEEPSPPVAWTATGQMKYQVLLRDPETGTYLWNSGIQVDPVQNAVTIPEGYITVVGKTYDVLLRIWDNEAREATPGFPIYTEVVKSATYTPSATVGATTNLTAVRQANSPGVILEWDSATMPDAFVVLRDGKVVVTLSQPEDYLLSGSRYRYIDLKVPGRQTHTWEVARIVNGQQSAGNDTETVYTKNIAPWLLRKNGTDAITLLEPDVNPGLSEESDVLFAQGGPPMLVTQSLWGYVGEASGLLANDQIPGVTAEEQKERFLRMRGSVGTPMLFMWSDEAIECHIYNTKIRQINNPDGTTEYEVSFGFIQVDY